MNLISSTEAAVRKGVTRQAIIKAIDRGDIQGHRIGPRSLVIVTNKRFDDWQPDLVRQVAGFAKRSK